MLKKMWNLHVPRLEAMQTKSSHSFFSKCFLFGLLMLAFVGRSYAATKFYEFNITSKPITRLCSTKSIILVNGKFPGPQIDVSEGDRVVIKVNNQVNHNITLHWHGIFQNRTGWFDGPAQVTQCPIQTGNSYVYKFTITGQRGTLWWHAHLTWLRATVYGSLIIHPKQPFPFLSSKEESPIEEVLILGEWWKSDVLDVMNQALATGGGSNISDAITINGMPGPLYGNCSSQDTHVLKVLPNKKYLLRIINAAMNMELFFGIANHTLTVVEADACYVKPFTTNAIVISPGQTATVLITTNQPAGSYYMAAQAFASAPAIPFDNTTSAAILKYPRASSAPVLPALPAFNDTPFVTNYEGKIRSLKKVRAEVPVPKKIDKSLFFAFGLNVQNCPPGASNTTCQGFGGRFRASMNNISYSGPQVAFLQQHFNQVHFNKTPIGYTKDFPAFPTSFNFTGSPALQNQNARLGTRAYVIPYGFNVQIVLQGTSLVVPENHPIHLHGYDFYVVGSGLGNFNSSRDTPAFNLVDPPLRNTIGVPAGGWSVIRFKADNPGTWILHCHLDLHSTWGLDMVLIVEDGRGALQKLEPPPKDLPPC